MPARRGFTLIELMVVLVVMATLAAAIVPGVASAMRRTGVPTATNQLGDLLDFASAAAISRGRAVTVNINPESGACWAVAERVSLPWRPAPEVEVRTLADLQLPESVRVSVREASSASRRPAVSGMESIRFGPDGLADEVLVELSGRDGQTAVIEVLSGGVRIRIGAEG